MRSFLLYLGYAAAAVPATFVKNREAFCLAAELPTVVVRYERHAENFLGMLHLASSLILLRHS